ncbi:MAG TPA: PilZ domain-containing protein [Candidatus Acidoferrum sp.]|nr:PilZ domain-containing protein [Candidatus Acidoferrum sp.]
MDNERRLSPRFSFIAQGELREEETNTRLNMRVSEISKTGCYVDMMNPLPSGTPIRLSIAAGGEMFNAKARIVYAVEHMGAGVHFEEVDSANAPILDRWIGTAQGEQALAAQ